MIYSINFSGTYGPAEICGVIPPGIYDLIADNDGHYRSCVPALPTGQFSGLSIDGGYPCGTMIHCREEPCVSCLDLFIRGDYWVFTDGIYEWTSHVINWDSVGSNRMTLTGGCDVCSGKPYEILVVATSPVNTSADWKWPSKPPEILNKKKAMKFGDGPSDSCTGWYCCKDNGQVVFLSDCGEKNQYACPSSSSISSIQGNCCLPPVPSVVHAVFSGSCGCFNGLVVTLVSTDGVLWTGTFTNPCVGGTTTLTITCVTSSPEAHFSISLTTGVVGCQLQNVPSTSGSCLPFAANWTGLNTGCCGGTTNISVS